MKTEEQIQEGIDNMKSHLVYAEGDKIFSLQGFIQALDWVLAKDKEEEEG